MTDPTTIAAVFRLIDVAETNIANASARANMLRVEAPRMDFDSLQDREWAVGLLLHHGYGAMEEALVILVGGPAEGVLARAAEPGDGRPAVIGAGTARRLEKLRAFREVFRRSFETFAYDPAKDLIPAAIKLAQDFREEVRSYAGTTGLEA